MMSNDNRICYIVVPDKKYYGKYNFSDFMTAILIFMFYKTSTRMRAPHPTRYHHWGTNQAKSKQEKKPISKNNVSRSFTVTSGCFCSYLHKYRLYNIFFLNTYERVGFLIPENIRIDILFMSLAYVVATLFVDMFIFIYFGGHLGFRYFRPFLGL